MIYEVVADSVCVCVRFASELLSDCVQRVCVCAVQRLCVLYSSCVSVCVLCSSVCVCGCVMCAVLA